MRSSLSLLGAALLTGALAFFAPAATADTECVTITVPDSPAPEVLACADLRAFDFAQQMLVGVDLHGANLAGVKLLQAILIGADLHGANLRGADLGQAQLGSVNLRGADLTGAKLGQADLTNADLRDAVLTDAQLTQARLNGADVRGADLRGANLTQAETDNVTGLAEAQQAAESKPAASRSDVRPDSLAAATESQIAYTLLWPAAALLLLWWRARLSYLARHRTATPLRVTVMLGGMIGSALVMAGLYLAAVGALRTLTSATDWAADPGPIALPPTDQLILAAFAFVAGLIVQALARGKQVPHPVRATGQVSVGTPTLARLGSGFGGPVRALASVAGLATLADIGTVVVLLFTGGLPDSGLWQDDTIVGHLAFAAIAMLVFFRAAAAPQSGSQVQTPSGVVFTSRAREPYLWLSGTDTDKDPASQALPWDALEHVHLIRILGSEHPSSMMLTVRRPGNDHATEYPKELGVTGAQAIALREILPHEQITEHSRAPQSE